MESESFCGSYALTLASRERNTAAERASAERAPFSINNKATRSCQVPVKEIKGKEVITIEGLVRGGKLHPLQKAFMDHDALQCGFCTPGMILSAYSLLLDKPNPTEAEIIQGMNDNLCRCGAHVRIVQAIQSAAKEMKGGRKG